MIEKEQCGRYICMGMLAALLLPGWIVWAVLMLAVWLRMRESRLLLRRWSCAAM